jgi:soluble lytic murein transglycosylase-like protein
MSWRTVVEFDLACARSRRRAAAKRAASARRAALNRRALRTFLVLFIGLWGLVGATTQVQTAPARPPAPKRPATPAASCGIPPEFAGAFRAASRETGLALSLLAAVAWEESRMDPDARSAAGARGLLQLMPDTARLVAVTKRDPRANILAGARYLRLMVDRFGGDLELALAAYNAGPTAVENAGAAPSIGTLRYAMNVEARAATRAVCA